MRTNEWITKRGCQSTKRVHGTPSLRTLAGFKVAVPERGRAAPWIDSARPSVVVSPTRFAVGSVRSPVTNPSPDA